MNILIVSQQYWPGNWRIVDVAEELVRRGNSVTVLCGFPNDATGRIPADFKNLALSSAHNGVTILRVRDLPRKTGSLNLFLNYLSFSKKEEKKFVNFKEILMLFFLMASRPLCNVNPGYPTPWLIGKKLCFIVSTFGQLA